MGSRDARPGKAGFSKAADEHSMTVKVPEDQYQKLQQKAQESGITATAQVRALISNYVDPLPGPEYVFANNEAGEGERELIIVARDGFSVRVPIEDGRIQADCIRVHDDREDEEVVYWSQEEWKEGNDGEDPTTAMNALLSAIQMVAFGTYRKFRNGRREEMLKEKK